jgi:threonine dehydratase
MQRSLATGHVLETTEHADTITDGLAVRSPVPEALAAAVAFAIGRALTTRRTVASGRSRGFPPTWRKTSPPSWT